jgi:hypothetical protein
MYHLLDIRWDVLNNRMSSYYVCYYHISGLNGVRVEFEDVSLLTFDMSLLFDDVSLLTFDMSPTFDDMSLAFNDMSLSFDDLSWALDDQSAEMWLACPLIIPNNS